MCVLSKEKESQDSSESKNTAVQSSSQDSVMPILDLMNNYVQKLRFGDQTDFVLMLGNTGAGKSTLTSLITGAELKSVEVLPDSGDFMIVDERGLISGKSTTTSQTIIPEHMFDKNNGITYYDCPGFNDTRNVAHDISVTFLIQRLITRANKLKLVFVVNYSSVRNGIGDRRDFLDLLQHAVTFVKNIDKYQNAIALIVTKVENHYVVKNKRPQLVDDCKVIETIAEFLKCAKSDLEKKKIRSDISAEENELNSKKIRFIDILLQTNDRNECKKIGILRLADDIGPVHELSTLQEEKKVIQSIIRDNVQFISKGITDFGYTISHESKNSMHGIMEQMQIRLANDLKDIGNEINEFYLQQEKYIDDIKVLKEKISNGYCKLSEVKSTNPKEFVKLIVDSANNLGIGVSFDNSNNVWKDVECVDFVKTVGNLNLSSFFNISTSLKDTMRYLDESQKWYQFLIDLHDHLSKYEVQKRLSDKDIVELTNQLNIEENGEIHIEDFGLKQFLADKCDFSLLTEINRLNSFKAKALKVVLTQTINNFSSTLLGNSLIVKGYNVKFSDVVDRCLTMYTNVKFVKVFALNNLFIDADIDKKGKKVQLSLFAPKWYIIGKRTIDLSGADGEPHPEIKAIDDNGISVTIKLFGNLYECLNKNYFIFN